MPADWYKTNLGEVVRAGNGFIQTGPFGSQLHASDYVKEGIPCIMPVNIIDGYINLNDIARISQSDAERLHKHIVQTGDIVYSRRGDVTRKALIREQDAGMFCGTGCLLIRPGDNINPRFLTYHLSTPVNQEWIIRHAVGATMPNLNTGILSDIPLNIPDKKTQEAIALVLSSLDDKIELNRQINTTLENMVQTLFKSWFVNFDPVLDNALAAGNPIPDILAEKAAARKALADARKALPEDIQQLFPAAFTWIEGMGWMPEGWEATNLSSLISIKHGYAFKGENFSALPTQDILLTPGNFKIGGGFKFDKLKFYDGPIPKDYLLVPNDLLVTMTDLSKAADTLGYPAFVPENSELSFLHNQRLGKIDIHHTLVGKEYIYRCLCSKAYRDEVLSSLTGTTVKHTSPKKILAFQLPFSNCGIELCFDKYCKPLTDKKNQLHKNNTSLTKLRDTLLPKLLSGELRIPDAQKLTEQAL